MPPAAKRQKWLKALRDLLDNERQALIDAISQDFSNRSADETLLAELMPSLHGIHHASRHLKGWMRASRRKVGVAFQPASAKVVYQPLGVVGVIVPWNYPLYLAIGPLVGALSAGDRVRLKLSESTPADGVLLNDLSARQAGHADCRPCMAAGFGTKQLVKQVRRAVDDFRVVGEIRRAVDHAEQPDHALHAVEIAGFGFHRRQDRQRGRLRRLVPLLHRHVLAQLAVLADIHSGMVRTMSRHEQDVADADTAAAVGVREPARLRQAVAHSLQFGFDAAHDMPSGNTG